ncbi:MAG: hypothetical protein P8Y95_14480, partial [Gammaproteobacteria bacterium]
MSNLQRIRLTHGDREDERIPVAALHEAFERAVPEDEDRVYLMVNTGFGRLRGTSEEVLEAARHHRRMSD